MTPPEFIDLPDDRRSRYPAQLADIKGKTTKANRDKWVMLKEFPAAASARDTSARLKPLHPEFDFTSRSDADTGVGWLYARYTGEL